MIFFNAEESVVYLESLKKIFPGDDEMIVQRVHRVEYFGESQRVESRQANREQRLDFIEGCSSGESKIEMQ